MQIQKENSMYAIHIGERGGTKWEGMEEIEIEEIEIAAIMRKGEISSCKGNILTNSQEMAKEIKRSAPRMKMVNMMNGKWDRVEENQEEWKRAY